MNNQNTMAIMAMCGIVITIYALRNAEAHYLPDLLGLALALAAPRQGVAIVAWLALAVVRHSGLALGLATLLPPWLIPLALPGARDMSISGAEYDQLAQAYKVRISEAETDPGNTEEPQPVAVDPSESILTGMTFVMAKAVISGAISIGEATKLASGVGSGRKYQVWNRRIKAEMERQKDHYPDLNRHKQQVPKGRD